MPGKQADIPSMFDKMNRKRKLSTKEPSSPPSAAAKRRHSDRGLKSPERELKSPEPKPSPRRSLRNRSMVEIRGLLDEQKISPLPKFSWGDHQTVWWNSMLVPDLKNKEERGSQIFEKNPEILPKMRSILLDWLIEVAAVYKLRRETYYLAQDYVDRVLYLSGDLPKNELQLLGITCMFIACKANEIYPPNVSDLAYVTDGACTEEAIIDHESHVLRILDWKVFIFTPTDWLSLFLQNSCRLAAPESRHKFEMPHFPPAALAMVATLLDLATLDGGCLNYSYSVLAATAFTLVYGRNLTLEITGLNWSDLTECALWMAKFAVALHVKGLVPVVGTSRYLSELPAPPAPPVLAFTTAPQDNKDPDLLQAHRTTMDLLNLAQQIDIHALNAMIDMDWAKDAPKLLEASPEKVLKLTKTPIGKQLEKTPMGKHLEETACLEMAPMKSVAVKSTASPSFNPKELFQSEDGPK
ncbi:G1/S-specific cyclin-E1 isoform X2 [Cloeon dipterum]|uniref:G1/S-specific cyclin-E1 isoform X2 n=1 Tax=Cloeon dipterum TaxID=197152 RepID=UPI00322070CA